MKIKNCIIIFILIIFPAFYVHSNGVQEENITINEIISETKEITDDVKDLSDNYIIKNVKKYNKLISDIKNSIDSNAFFFFSKSEKSKLNIFIKGLKEMTDFYKEITSEENKDQVKNELLSYIDSVQMYKIELENLLFQEENEKKKLKNELEMEIVKKTSSNIKDFEIIIESLNQRIKYSERRISMMETFIDRYSKIEPIINDASNTIDDFIFTLEQTGMIYESAYKTAEMGRDISIAYNTIGEFISLETLSLEIQNSWVELESIISDLTNELNNQEKSNLPY